MADSKKYDGSQWEHSLRKLTTATEAVENPLYSDGTAITNYTIKGNTVQNGTPTPSNPVDVNGVGERTKNLLKNEAVSREFNGLNYTVNSDKSITIYGTVSSDISYFVIMGDGAASNSLGGYQTPIFNAGDTLKFSTNSGVYMYCRYTDGSWGNIQLNGIITLTKDIGMIYLQFANGQFIDSVIYPMITLSTEDTTYEPYGYKIPISNGQQTTNIYLGSTQTVREIKKLVLDGTENYGSSGGNTWLALGTSAVDFRGTADGAICSHLPLVLRSNFTINTCAWGGGQIGDFLINIDNKNMEDLKSYIAQQYTNGTPVTVWYVLETPQTAAVNEPLMKIGTYADTLSNAAQIPTTEGANSITVDTTVQPSEFTATWTGWHNANVKEWDGTNWN